MSPTPSVDPNNRLTARQIVERIQQNIGIPWRDATVDTFKMGDPDDEVSGIAVTMMPTLEVLRKAAFSGLNLVISHEAAFYGHHDETRELEGENDAVFACKREFIQEQGLILWRIHDHWHWREPDGIRVGMIKALGWESYQNAWDNQLFEIPEQTLGQLARQLKATMGIRTIRVVGDANLRLKKVALSPGFPGFEAQRHLLQRDDVEALVIGEAHEWETIAYAADAQMALHSKALIILGHIPSEQAGMEEFARWLKELVSEVPIEFLPTAEPFWAPD